MSTDEVESIVCVQSKDSAIRFWKGVVEALSRGHTTHASLQADDDSRSFGTEREFQEFLVRVREGQATAKVRKLFWYKGGDCHVAEEIWFADKSNPISRANPLKSYTVVHVHYHGQFSALPGDPSLLLEVDAVNARHLASVNQCAQDYSVDSPFFDTWIEKSGPTTWKVFPPAGSRSGCAALKWRSPDCSSSRRVQTLLQAADWAVPWNRGDEKSHRSGNDAGLPCSGPDDLALSDYVLKISAMRLLCEYPLSCESVVDTAEQGQSLAHSRRPVSVPNLTDVDAHPVAAETQDGPQYGTEEPDPPPSQIRVLFLGANNHQAVQLCLERERNELERAFQKEICKSTLQPGQAKSVEPVFQHQFYANASELVDMILEHEPVILHLGCHGDKSGLSFFESAAEKNLLVKKITIVQQGFDSSKKIRLAIVNACMSRDLAHDLSSCIDFVIGYQGKLPDERVALSFSKSFYGHMGRRKFSLLDCFELASGVDMREVGKYCFFSPRVDPAKFKIVQSRPCPTTGGQRSHGLDARGVDSPSLREQEFEELHRINERCSRLKISLRPDAELRQRLNKAGLERFADFIAEQLGAESVEDMQRHVTEQDVQNAGLLPVQQKKLLTLIRDLQEEAAYSRDQSACSQASTTSEGGSDSDSELPMDQPREKEIVMGHNTANFEVFGRLTKDFIDEFRHQVYTKIWIGTDETLHSLSFCAIVLLNLLCSVAVTTPKFCQEGEGWFKRFRSKGTGFDEELLDRFVALFDHAHPRSRTNDLQSCAKKGSLCVAIVDKEARKVIEGNFEAWESTVLKSWFNTAELVGPFLQRADQFFCHVRWNECKIRTLRAIQTGSFQAFLVMDQFTEMLLFAYLQHFKLEGNEHALACDQPKAHLYGFISFVSSSGKTWTDGVQTLPYLPSQTPSKIRLACLNFLTALDLEPFSWTYSEAEKAPELEQACPIVSETMSDQTSLPGYLGPDHHSSLERRVSVKELIKEEPRAVKCKYLPVKQEKDLEELDVKPEKQKERRITFEADREEESKERMRREREQKGSVDELVQWMKTMRAQDEGLFPADALQWFQEHNLDAEAVHSLTVDEISKWATQRAEGGALEFKVGPLVKLMRHVKEIVEQYPDPDRDEKLVSILGTSSEVDKISLLLCDLNLAGVVRVWRDNVIAWSDISEMVEQDDWIGEGPQAHKYLEIPRLGDRAKIRTICRALKREKDRLEILAVCAAPPHTGPYISTTAPELQPHPPSPAPKVLIKEGPRTLKRKHSQVQEGDDSEDLVKKYELLSSVGMMGRHSQDLEDDLMELNERMCLLRHQATESGELYHTCFDTAFQMVLEQALAAAVLRGLLPQGHRVNEHLPDSFCISDVERPTALHVIAEKGTLECAIVLLEAGADPDVRSGDGDVRSWGETPLHVAARHNNSDVAWTLLEAGASTETEDVDGKTPLHVAVSFNRADVARVLVEGGADMESKDMYGSTPLHRAAWSNHREVAAVLLEAGVDTETTDESGRTPLHVAAQNNHVEVARALLEAGADEEAEDTNTMTPLHASAHKNHVEVAGVLLEAGANKDARAVNGETPLHVAAQNDCAEMAKVLLEAGADTEAKNVDMQTSLHLSGFFNRADVARVLVEGGADMESKDMYGETALHRAAWRNHREVAAVLLEAGADTEPKDESGTTPLHVAAQANHVEVARALLEAGADREAEDVNRSTPLHFTAWSNHGGMAGLLLQEGSNKEAKDVDGETPLHVAVSENHRGVVKMLLKAGADKEAKNTRGRTPLHVAVRSNLVGLTRLLLAEGSDKDARALKGYTPLHIAARYNHVEVASVLLEEGAATEAKLEGGSSPLHIAAGLNHVDVCGVLLDGGADIDAKDKNGQTPLDVAKLNESHLAATLLSNAGANTSTGTTKAGVKE